MRPAVAGAFVYLAFMWGSTYMFIKVGLQYWPPILMASARNLLAGLAVVGVIFLLRRQWPQNWRGWWPPLVFGLINGTSFALIFWGQQYIPSGQSAVLIAVMPIFTLFLAWWWLGEELTGLKLLAVVLGIAGVALATGVREGVGFSGSSADRLLGQGAMIGAAFCYAASYVFGKKYFKADIYVNTAVHLCTAGAYLSVLSFIFDSPATGAIFTWPALGSLIYLALPGSALAYLSMFFLMENLNSLQASYAILLNPVVAVFLGVALLGEALTASMLLGAVLVVGGVWLVNRARA